MNKIMRFIKIIKNIEKQNNELLWAQIWKDTCRNMEWINGLPSISPGRWAVGYNYIYVLTRVLDSINPQKILDLGLGVSSTIISCFFKYHKIGVHDIVEQDKEWAEFYQSKNILSSNSNVHILECIEKEYTNGTRFIYKDFKKQFIGRKYSLISIDGPWGSDHHSRRDIINLLPDILENEFVIIMDDTNRIGEKETVKEIINVLKSYKINVCEGYYPGITGCTVICSECHKFLCSL